MSEPPPEEGQPLEEPTWRIFCCTIETPWKPGIPGPVRHFHAVRGGTCEDGCCDRFFCPVCGHVWLQELPD